MYVALEELRNMGRCFFKDCHTKLLEKLNDMIDDD